MAEFADESGESNIVERRPRRRRLLRLGAIALVVLVAVASVILWTQRKPIARKLIRHQLESSGVRGHYEIGKLGLRTQELKNVVIGNPNNPDLTADRIRLQSRLELNGTIDVYRIVARGVRLRGKVLADGSVSWGEIDKLLPARNPNEPKKPFQLPDVSLDIADASISLQTPWGALGFAVEGNGNLTGGFKGHLVSSSPKLLTGNCVASNVRGSAAIEVMARRPHVVGPLTANAFSCPPSHFSVIEPRLELDARLAEAFDRFDASARIMSQEITAGDNGLAALNGRISFIGKPDNARGQINLAAQKSRLGTIFARRTRVSGKYRLSTVNGSLTLVGHYAANNATLDPSMLSGLTGALQATGATPIGPAAAAIGKAINASARNFDVGGGIKLVNFPGGGAARVTDAAVRTASGGRARIAGGKGITFYWPSGRLRFDGRMQMAGGGLPTGTVILHQQPNGAISGVGNFAPYTAGGARLSLATLRFSAQPSGATRFATVAGLTGMFPGGQVRNLNLPISGTVGANGGIAVGQKCMIVTWDYLKMQAIQFDRSRLPICPVGVAIVSQSRSGGLHVGGRIGNPALAGSIGSSPMQLKASSVLVSNSGFSGTDVALRLGRADAPVELNARTLRGAFRHGGAAGTLSNADAMIGVTPLKMTDIDGKWQFAGNRLTIDGGLMLHDRADPPRFNPLKSNDVHFVMADNRITTTGTLRHPETGTKISDVDILHDLDTGAGHADLDVPGISFGPRLQPDQLTRLAEGVVALVRGKVHGHGRIDWSPSGEVTSTGDFATRNMDLAAPFGPVDGLTTSIHFTDLLGLQSSPGQVARVRRINPGITVDNGVITYRLLPNQLVKVERGEWPFMGGKLILHETILNFGAPQPKRLTFELVGFDAEQFIDSFGFEGLKITGTFDGVLPMIFDENGGRIVGGRLDSQAPGGEFAYTGTKPKAGMVAGLAFDLLSDIRYRSMTVRLDGDLAGEFATRFTIGRISLGGGGGFVAGLVRSAFTRVPLQVNLNISGPFRSLIQMAKGFKDPTMTISPVMPFPLDSPGIATETHILKKEEEQNRTTRLDEVDVSTKPPPPSEAKP